MFPLTHTKRFFRKKKIRLHNLAKETGYSAAHLTRILNGKSTLTQKAARILLSVIQQYSHKVNDWKHMNVYIHELKPPGEKNESSSSNDLPKICRLL